LGFEIFNKNHVITWQVVSIWKSRPLQDV